MCRNPSPYLTLILFLLAAPLSAAEAETGEASWYGPGFHGRRTANGEVFDKEAMTAAHRTLPFGTLVRVRNLDNGREAVLRINDRGPFARGRILDVSEAGARVLGMVESGTARVRIEVLGAAAAAPGASEAGAAPNPEGSGPAVSIRIQVASYRDAGNAGRAAERLRLSGMNPALETEGAYTRVVLTGIAPSERDALVRRLADLGYPGVLVRTETRY
jgi:rare lipoprotein A